MTHETKRKDEMLINAVTV